MICSQSPSNAFIQQKLQIQINFRVQKHVRFGQALYVSGNIQQLGNWQVSQSFRLLWEQGDFWTGSFNISKIQFEQIRKIQYKYFFGFWKNPRPQTSTWQQGKHNRCLQYNSSHLNLFIDEKWNVDKIKLSLVVKRFLNRKNIPEYTYSLISSCPELGNWREKKQLSLQQNLNRKISTYINQNAKKQDILKYLNNQIYFQMFSFQFQVKRSTQSIRYYYIRKHHDFQIERHPGRTFPLQSKKFPLRYGVIYQPGVINVIDEQNFNKPTFSRITTKLYVGSYLKTQQDLKILKQLGINCVCSIQTDKDHSNHGISPFYLELLCNQNKIKYKCYSIEDKNPRDFIRKCGEVIQGLDQFQKEEGNKTYVHCTAGKYRSPQIIALYLILKNGFQPAQAIRMVKERHPYANPNQNIIETAVCYIHSEERRLNYCKAKQMVQ